ncbi:uncharacterized protein LOC127863158 isoform X3 [Dreissena polymorpha]|uniref:uncharacterized protein LOC127863158 isoform X3 n=1 Tax=Dreissena polymorpha TaxID=45954 RepID=UPI0022651CDE|nr:uncharacterized protein LOC127863158 isoform X3 [Dreissena polymorpha]
MGPGWKLARSKSTPLTGPRTVHIPRTERGYGFTLRHFIVYPPAPKNFLKERDYTSDEDQREELYYQQIESGSLQPLDTIFVKNVREGGPAQLAGLNAGDRIISVNGEPVTGRSYGQVISLIQHTTSDLSLLVVPKEEDILQLAYENSSQSFDSDYCSQSAHTYSRQSSMDSSQRTSRESRDRKVLSTSSLDANVLLEGQEPGGGHVLRTLRTSTSYTSGLGGLRDSGPMSEEQTMNKSVFLDRRREFEARAAQENVNPNASKAYSFGLYFPKKEAKVNSSVENLAREVAVKRSRESVLQPTDSQENISKTQGQPSRTRNVPIEYRHSSSPDPKIMERLKSQTEVSTRVNGASSGSGFSSSIRHSFPDSGLQVWTSPRRRTSDTNSPHGFLGGGTPIPDGSRQEVGGSNANSWQYVPVISDSSIARSQNMSASVDSIDPRSNVYHTEHQLRTAYNKNAPMMESTPKHKPPPSRTFIVKIGDGEDRSTTPVAGNAASYGAAFAVTRSPNATEVEIRHKSREPRILVSHRKKQFEERKDLTPPVGNAVTQRYKTEVTSFRKFDGIQARLASFESSSSAEQSPSRSQTPVGPAGKTRQQSMERLTSPEPQGCSTPYPTQGNTESKYSEGTPIRIYLSQGNSKTAGSPIVEIVPMPSSYKMDSAAPDGRSAGFISHSGEASEQVENDGQKPVRKGSFLSAVNAPYSRYLPQTGYDNETPSETPKSSRNYITSDIRASNQSLSREIRSSNQNVSHDVRLSNQSLAFDLRSSTQSLSREGAATPTPTWRQPSPARALSPSSLGDSSVDITLTTNTVTLTSGSGTVRMRNKPELTAEDAETKLHRRTSYLMATAKDRSAASLAMSPHSNIPIDPSTPAAGQMGKHKSMRKLKDFFGEKTPRIMEAQEKKLDPFSQVFKDGNHMSSQVVNAGNQPASPLQGVIKEGNLAVKLDVIDGKRAGDRSWRPVWAVLRGHALYLCKERRDPVTLVAHALPMKVRAGSQTSVFSYEEQPISVKSCIVDIAHSYTKRKNVFRLKTYNGSEYLLQADDQMDMLVWIRHISANNNPDLDANGVTNAELIIRKSQELTESGPTLGSNTSPTPAHKITKKLSVIKQKVPQSPSIKRRKTVSGDKLEDTGKPKTWKGKLGKSIKKHMGSSSSTGQIAVVPETGGMFGVPLEDCLPSPNNEFVPLIVDLCIQIVEARGLEMTGVYRIPGNKAAVTILQEEFNKGIDCMNLEHEKWCDVNVISSLLKSFFRQLPEPLIPDDLYQPFIDASRNKDSEKRMLKLKALIHKLPEHHLETFKHLARHLNRVAQYADVNRMQAKNLAIVFGPTLIRKADDNMVAMVTDMSDHCKIIESIILHCEWIFGSWDMDSSVPTDDEAAECMSLVSAPSSSNMREEAELNPREIVSSIVSAANRKLRGESPARVLPPDKRSVSVSDPPLGYNERNIDNEILIRTQKIDTTSRSSPNLAAMQHSTDLLKPLPDLPDRRMAKSQDFVDREFSDFDFIDSEKENSVAFLTPMTQYFSDESLLDRNDELELSHGSTSLHGSFNRLRRETIDSLRRIELEARAIREREEREERRQREEKKRQLERQRIEADILQTQRELEIEDRHSVEDLLQATTGYSLSLHPHGDTPEESGRTKRYGGRDSHRSDKHIVVKSNAGSNYRSARQPRQMSAGSLSSQAKRTGSVENMADGHSFPSAINRPTAQVKAQSKRDSAEIKRRSAGLTRTGSVRRGSLDSLIDLLERRDNRMSWASTDSDEGFDLLATLTSTFDKKLQTLSSAKMSNCASSSKPPRWGLNSNGGSVSNGALPDAGDSPAAQTAQHRLPPQPPLSHLSRQAAMQADNQGQGKQYRDPSLHRTPPKSDAKIGLATRFERSTTHNPLYEGHSEPSLNLLVRSGSNNSGINLHSDVTYSADSAVVQGVASRGMERSESNAAIQGIASRGMERSESSASIHGAASRGIERSESDSRVASVMVVISSPSIMSADSSGRMAIQQHVSKPLTAYQSPLKSFLNSQNDGLHGDPLRTETPSKRPDYRPITKSEKTEVNVRLSQSLEKNRAAEESDAASRGPVSESVPKTRSASPPVFGRKRNEQCKRRRHTVGGTSDSNNILAMDAALSNVKRQSAWEQLRPNVGANVVPHANMQSWLQAERLRGSSPDLSSLRDRGNRQATS